MPGTRDPLAIGALANLEGLVFNRNQIGDVGIQAFVSAVANLALPRLRVLSLGANRIGDAGMTALAAAA